MSAYRVIQTEFRNLDSLLKALKEIGYENVKNTGTSNTMSMWGYHGDLRPETCAVWIDRAYVGSASNDVGFAWNEKTGTYQAIISDYDQQATFTPSVMGKLKQQYAFQELSRQAKQKGYTVQQEQTPQGTIRMKLVRR